MKRLKNKNETFFDVIDSELKAYLLGYFYADGYNYVQKDRIAITLAEQDSEIIDLFRSNLSPESKITRIQPKSVKHQLLLNVTIVSKNLCQSLVKHGCMQKKSLILEFPTIKEDLLRHFVRGYFDGDGCIYFKIRQDRAFVAECPIVCSNSFSKTLSSLIENRFKFKPYCQKLGKNKLCTTLKVTGRTNVFVFLDWLYRDCQYKLSRKYQKYLDFNQLNKVTPILRVRKKAQEVLLQIR